MISLNVFIELKNNIKWDCYAIHGYKNYNICDI